MLYVFFSCLFIYTHLKPFNEFVSKLPVVNYKSYSSLKFPFLTGGRTRFVGEVDLKPYHVLVEGDHHVNV